MTKPATGIAELAATLRGATAKVASAKAASDTAVDALRAHNQTAAADAERLATLERRQEDYRVAVALGDEPSVDEPDADEIAQLRERVAVNERVGTVLGERVTQANLALKTAEEAHRKAAHAYVTAAAIEPARTKFEAALEPVREAMVELMAAHNLAFDHFGNPNGWPVDADDYFGPAAYWLRHLRKLEAWQGRPYSLRPAWLPTHPGYGGDRPDAFPGFAEARDRLLRDVAEIAA